MKRIIPFLLALVTFSAVAQNDLPKVDMTTLDGAPINSNDLSTDDNVIVISLWATWCVPCIKELDAISEIYPDWQAETNVKLYAISIDDSRGVQRVKPMVNGKGWDYTVLLDTNNDFKRAVGAATVPLTLLVKNNQIVYRHSGYSPGAELELYEKIKEFSVAN
ncbi:TlpA disulfide reductase family protein [Aequorivita sp. SDUM287046]|uniref:TlpA disulfide reductase family protein n=1 Tax=Aequorivita aurantiaca TaxID=3053356 RepID=A0ABT8DI11_9FLAO|nr:TlpA disulfide reductase family protein [Aequorivita aurantiaca]MDN3724542.1 TlpA disulfide reductase family protein [Aequorivita aurantiaca]